MYREVVDSSPFILLFLYTKFHYFVLFLPTILFSLPHLRGRAAGLANWAFGQCPVGRRQTSENGTARMKCK